MLVVFALYDVADVAVAAEYMVLAVVISLFFGVENTFSKFVDAQSRLKPYVQPLHWNEGMSYSPVQQQIHLYIR